MALHDLCRGYCDTRPETLEVRRRESRHGGCGSGLPSRTFARMSERPTSLLGIELEGLRAAIGGDLGRN